MRVRMAFKYKMQLYKFTPTSDEAIMISEFPLYLTKAKQLFFRGLEVVQQKLPKRRM